MGALAGRQVPAVEGAVLEAALAAAPELGEDQVAAVKVLAGQGGGLRAVLAPAGYGKNTMLHAAAHTAARDGRPVAAVATTAKAVAELAGAGLDARTIARLCLDLANGPLATGTVVVLDEVSQTPTHESKLSWPRSTPARAARYGSWATLASPSPSAPAGWPTTSNASLLTAPFLRPGSRSTAASSTRPTRRRSACSAKATLLRPQQLRTDHDWEHELATPDETRHMMADAVCTDIGRYGAEQVAALVVSHTDAEDVADRVRDRLAATGTLTGPALVGPGGRLSGSTGRGTRCSSTPVVGPRAPRSSTAPLPLSPPSKKLGSGSSSTAAGSV